MDFRLSERAIFEVLHPDNGGGPAHSRVLYGSLDDPSRVKFLWWLYEKRHLLGRRHFSHLLGVAWVTQPNVPIFGAETVELFENAVPEVLMTPADLSAFRALPDEITAYQGCADVGIEEAAAAMTWTLDHEVAVWFAERLAQRDPFVVRATIRKSDVLAYFHEPVLEAEIVVRPGRVSDVQRVPGRIVPLTGHVGQSDIGTKIWNEITNGASE